MFVHLRPQTSMASKGTSSYVLESVEVAHLNKQEKKQGGQINKMTQCETPALISFTLNSQERVTGSCTDVGNSFHIYIVIMKGLGVSRGTGFCQQDSQPAAHVLRATRLTQQTHTGTNMSYKHKQSQRLNIYYTQT